MSLETEIKKLRESIEAFTKVFEKVNKSIIIENIQQTDIEVKKDEPVEVIETKLPLTGGPNAEREFLKKQKNEVKEKESENKPLINLQIVKELTKEKMAAGIERKKLKDIIISIKAGASLPDLNQEELEKAYDLMKYL